jgi:RNA polymerase sigma-70 factor (ECF subfamily)
MRLDTATNTTLLDRLKDVGNATAWADYVERYRPLIVGYCLRLQLPHADAEDVAQDAFAASYRAGGYQRERGPLRAWMFGIVRHAVLDWRRGRGRRAEQQPRDSGSGTGFLDGVPGDDKMAECWEAEWRQAVIQQCLTEVRRQVEPATIAAFELFAVQGLPAEQVATRLGVSTNAVFVAKHRVLRRMRELQPMVEAIW